MVLVHLFSKSYHKNIKSGVLGLTIVLVTQSLALDLVLPEKSYGAITGGRTVNTFPELRAEVLELIASAQTRIWLTTDYLTDGEIVAALYIAKYRKIDVQVLLSRPKARHYMSRLGNLKSQNIPVFLRPSSFDPHTPSAVLVDQTLMIINGELDFLAKIRSFTFRIASDQERDDFATGFAEGINLKTEAIPKPIPLVGHPLNSEDPPTRLFIPQTDSKMSPLQPASPPEASDAYHYGRTREKKPVNIPTKLPKQLKWERQGREPIPETVPALPAPVIPADGGSP